MSSKYNLSDKLYFYFVNKSCSHNSLFQYDFKVDVALGDLVLQDVFCFIGTM